MLTRSPVWHGELFFNVIAYKPLSVRYGNIQMLVLSVANQRQPARPLWRKSLEQSSHNGARDAIIAPNSLQSDGSVDSIVISLSYRYSGDVNKRRGRTIASIRQKKYKGPPW